MESELETQLNSFQGDQNIDPSLAEAETEFQDDSEMPETPGGMSSSSTQHKNKRKRENKGISSETAEMLMAMLRDVDGLSVDERMKATIIISRDSSLTDVFFSLIPEDILAFVKTVLNNYF